jgi:hypothetical protein
MRQSDIWESQLDTAVSDLASDKDGLGKKLLDFADCAWESFKDHYGLSTVAGVSGIFATPIPKNLVPPYRVIGTPTTNLLSVIGHFVELNIPRISVAGRASTNLLRVAGRVNPYLAVGLSALDAATIANDASECYKNKNDNRPHKDSDSNYGTAND